MRATYMRATPLTLGWLRRLWIFNEEASAVFMDNYLELNLSPRNEVSRENQTKGGSPPTSVSALPSLSPSFKKED